MWILYITGGSSFVQINLNIMDLKNWRFRHKSTSKMALLGSAGNEIDNTTYTDDKILNYK